MWDEDDWTEDLPEVPESVLDALAWAYPSARGLDGYGPGRNADDEDMHEALRRQRLARREG